MTKKMRFYFCRGCNAKNNQSRNNCVQCGRNLKDRMLRPML